MYGNVRFIEEVCEPRILLTTPIGNNGYGC